MTVLTCQPPATQFAQPERSKQNAWAHPVIAGGRLYLRDQDILFCYDVKRPGQ